MAVESLGQGLLLYLSYNMLALMWLSPALYQTGKESPEIFRDPENPGIRWKASKMVFWTILFPASLTLYFSDKCWEEHIIPDQYEDLEKKQEVKTRSEP